MHCKGYYKGNECTSRAQRHPYFYSVAISIIICNFNQIVHVIRNNINRSFQIPYIYNIKSFFHNSSKLIIQSNRSRHIKCVLDAKDNKHFTVLSNTYERFVPCYSANIHSSSSRLGLRILKGLGLMNFQIVSLMN